MNANVVIVVHVVLHSVVLVVAVIVTVTAKCLVTKWHFRLLQKPSKGGRAEKAQWLKFPHFV